MMHDTQYLSGRCGLFVVVRCLLWRGAGDEDGGLFVWIAEHSKAGDGKNEDGVKPCPKCGMPIEKNGACPVMRCGGHAHSTNQVKVGCGAEFCWICEEIISGSHSCNRVPVKKKATDADETDFEYLGHVRATLC